MPEQGAFEFATRGPATPGPAGRRVVLAAHPRRVLPGVDGFDAVLVPNARAARALGVPGRPRSVEAAATRALREVRAAGATVTRASVLQERRLLRQAIREVVRPDDLEGTVRTWGPTVREVLRAGFGADDARPLDAPSPRSRQVLDVAGRYRELLRAAGLVDRAELLWLAAGRVTRRERVLVAGYPRVGLGELAFLDAFAADGSVVVLPSPGGEAAFATNEDAAAYLSERGWRVERPHAAPATVGERWAVRLAGARGVESEPDVEVRALRYPDQEEEVRGVLTDVKALLLGGADPGSIALIARDEALYGPLVRAVAQEYGVPVRLSYAVPLRETRVGGWLADLVACLAGGFPFETTARLLAHPLSRRLDGEVWAEARGTHPQGLDAWTALVPDAAALAWPARAERGAFGDRLERTLADLGVSDGLARLDPLSLDRRAERRFRLALRELGEEAGPAPRDAFLAEIDDALSGLSVPLDAPTRIGDGAAAVELHTPLAVFGARYRHVFVLGMADGLTPAPVRDDPVLDFVERSRLRGAGVPMESAAEAAERELLSFWAALETAEERVTLSQPELVGGRERVVSPFFERLGLAPRAAPRKPPASRMEARAAWLRGPEGAADGGDAQAGRTAADPEARHALDGTGPDRAVGGAAGDPVLPHARAAWRVERRREGAAPWDAFDGVVGVPLDPDLWPFSASQLTSLGQCAFRWFAQRRLRLGSLEEAEEEVSPLFRGRLYHLALALALEPARAAQDPRAVALERLDEAFAQAEATVGVPAQPSWPIRRPYHLEVLRRALRAGDFFTEDGTILSLEERFRGAWRGLRVTGIVDRVDAGPDGLVLLDYKTRASKPDGAKDSSGKATLDVQLPLYVETAAPTLHPGEAVAAARYYSLTKARALAEANIDDDELSAFVQRVRAHLEQGSYPVDPDVDAKACAYCDFDLVCRRGPRLERKRQGAAV